MELILDNGYHNSRNICYVCSTTTSLETHHIIPVSLGGEKGPLIDLCNNCHGMVHKVASSKKPSKSKKINYLASIIIKHSANVGKDKPIAFSTRFTSVTNAKLLKLADLFNTSKSNVIVMAIHSMYAKHF